MSIRHNLLRLGLVAGLLFGGTAGALAARAIVDTPLNVRDGRGTQHRVLDVAHRGEIVDVEYCRGSWCFITRRGPDGWVSARYLSRGGGYYDDDFYIDRRSHVYVPPFFDHHHRHRHHRHHHFGSDFRACFGGDNARFCISD